MDVMAEHSLISSFMARICHDLAADEHSISSVRKQPRKTFLLFADEDKQDIRNDSAAPIKLLHEDEVTSSSCQSLNLISTAQCSNCKTFLSVHESIVPAPDALPSTNTAEPCSSIESLLTTFKTSGAKSRSGEVCTLYQTSDLHQGMPRGRHKQRGRCARPSQTQDRRSQQVIDQLTGPSISQADIKTKLESHGVKVSDRINVPIDNTSGLDKPRKRKTKPQKISDDTSPPAVGPSLHHEPSNAAAEIHQGRGDRPRRGGRANGCRGKLTIEPANRKSGLSFRVEIPKPDPKRHETNWFSNAGDYHSDDSVRANGEWDGNFNTSPTEWDSRPAFRDLQSSEIIQGWCASVAKKMRKINTVMSLDLFTTGDGKQYYFSTPDDVPRTGHEIPMGDLVPHYWIPETIDKKDRQVFWSEYLRSMTPKTCDPEDLAELKPWWEHENIAKGLKFLDIPFQPEKLEIDPDESRDERLHRETDFGSKDHIANRKRFEQAKAEEEDRTRHHAKKQARRREELEREQGVSIRTTELATKTGISVRRARVSDAEELRAILNYYIKHTCAMLRPSSMTVDDMINILQQSNAQKLPALVAVEKGKIMRPNRKHRHAEPIQLPNRIVGLAFAHDFQPSSNIVSTNTVEIKVFVHHDFYNQSIGSCLLDKLMALLDINYIERAGYALEEENMYDVSKRSIRNMIIQIPYDDPNRRDWIKRWLSRSAG